MDYLSSFFGRAGFLPHGYCFTWTPALLWSMVGADGVIAAAYFSIPVALLTYSRKRGDASMRWPLALFSAFIFACGITHLLDIWTIWQPDYGLQALAKTVTAAISLVTALVLWPLIPKALKLPSTLELRTVIASLEREVAQRRNAEASAIDMEQNLAVTLASIDAGFLAADRAGRVTHMNEVAERVTGWRRDEALGRGLLEVWSREGMPAHYQSGNPVDLMIELGNTVYTPVNVVAIARDGSRTPVEVRASLTHGDDGAVRGLAMVFRDRTDEVRARGESQRLAAIVESSYDAIIGKTLDGRITDWNGAAQAMFGYSAAEAIGRPIQMLLPPDREAEEMRILTDLAKGTRVPPFDTVRRAKDGHLIDVSVTISPIRDASGRIVGASKIARDVTLQRRAEAALRDSEARLRFTLEAAQIGDWELDFASGAARRSPRHDRCFGYDTTQAEWNFAIFERHVHPDDRVDVVRQFKAAVRDRTDWACECRVVWPDDSVHWIQVKGKIQYDAGEAVRMLGIIVDTTRQKFAEQARLTAERLEAENRQVLEASRLKSQFLANMSHELRTPLNAIIGFADLLQTGGVPAESPKRKVFLGHIATSGRHLLHLINDVLDLSKVESGKFEFHPEPVDLATLSKDVTDILHTQVLRKYLRVEIDVEPELIDIVLDPSRLKQVLYNYLSNAIKFTPEGGRITVRARAQGAEHFRLEVEDSGIGIAAADLPRLFTEFLQLDAGYTKQHQGTGLGLALCRQLVQAQGGLVGVHSTPGVGSVFHLVLNRVHGAYPLQHTAATDEAAAVDTQRMLVAHEQGGEQARLVHALIEAGFWVDTASTGQQAVDRALGDRYDGIALDMRLSDGRGLGVLAQMRNQGTASPVVGMSMPIDAGGSASFAIADVLAKPIRADEVIAAMRRLGLPSAGRSVMVIDDDPQALDLMQAMLKGIGLDATCLTDGAQALRDIDEHSPCAIILDLMMANISGFEVLDRLRRLPDWRDTPVLIWTSMILTDEEFTELSRSAQAIVGKGGGSLDVTLAALKRWRAQKTPAHGDVA